jgi:DNA-binding response OmpR family regulator
MRILVIEDNTFCTSLTTHPSKGFTVDCAQDGLGGLHLASTGHAR